MECTKQEMKLELQEEISLDEKINEESHKTFPLQTEENMFIPMKIEDVIKPEDKTVIKTEDCPGIADINNVKCNIAPKDSLKVELSENGFKTETMKSEDLKTMVIKHERIDEKRCVDGLKLCEESNSCNNENIYILPTDTPDETNQTDNYSEEEESNIPHSFTEFNFNMGVEDSVNWTGSTAKVKKKYDRPIKYICSFCDKGFTSITDLRDHTRTHTGERPYPCSYCNKPFRTKTLLKLHLQLHIGKRYKCAECGMSFPQVGPLKVHMRSHTGDRPFHCSKCSRGYTSKPSLIKHFKTKCYSSNFVVKKGDSYIYICSICNKNYKKKDCLSQHIQNVHIKQKSFPCKICGMVCSSSGNQTKHERLHKNEFSFLCNECNMSFKEKGGLVVHLNSVHSESKPFSCNLCNASFKNLNNLKSHNIVHHVEKNPNKYVCEVCKLGFYRMAYLKRHLQTHTDSDKIHTCNECGMKCRSKTDMARHVVIHIGGGDKPFKCDICVMAFSRHGKLLRHQLVHSKEKPYKCDLCTKAYKDSSSLKVHKDSFHKETIYL